MFSLVVPDGAADAARVGGGVVDQARRHGGVAAALGHDHVRERDVPRDARVEVAEAHDGLPLSRRHARPEGREVAVQQTAVGGLREAVVLEGRARDDAVEEAGVVLGDHQLLDGAARAAPAHRPDGRPAQLLDQAFLDHRHGLGRQHVVAVDAEGVQRRGRVRVALREHVVVEHRGRTQGALVVTRAAAAAELIAQAPVPAAAGLAAVGQDRPAVDGAVDRAGLDAHDVVDGLARARGRLGQVGRPGVRVGERLERVGLARAVVVVHSRGGGAVRVLRRAEVGAFGAADERLLVRTREDRAGDRVVHQLEGVQWPPAALAVGVGGELVAADDEAVDQTDQPPRARPVGSEGAGHVAPVEQDPRLVDRHGLRHSDGRQHVPAADRVRTRGQRLDREPLG